MTPEDITYIKTLVSSLGFGALIAAGIGYLLLRQHLSGYLAAKGKNLADKEDIAKLTQLVEGVKLQSAMTVEQFKVRTQLRFAALDKRLLAHQQAFTLYRRLVYINTRPGTLEKAVTDCQDWWDANCLYLEPDAREAFREAIVHAAMHPLMSTDPNRKEWNYKWLSVLTRTGTAITRGVQLPGLTQVETREIEGSIPSKP